MVPLFNVRRGFTSMASGKHCAVHPFGMWPRGDSSKESGKRAEVAGSMPEGVRPSSFARTGSKSTNQLWKSARAVASRVAFIRRFNSILSSSAPSTSAIRFCSARGGRVIFMARWSRRLTYSAMSVCPDTPLN